MIALINGLLNSMQDRLYFHDFRLSAPPHLWYDLTLVPL